MATIFSILINPVTVSVLVLCALCLTGLNVLLSMLIACIIGGVAGGIPLHSAPEGTQTVMQLLTSGFASNATTALAYILLGTFATCISTTGLAEILSKKLSRLLGGHRLALIGVLTLVAWLSQNLIPVHIAYIPILVPPLLGMMNRMKLDRRAVACALAFGHKVPYITIPFGFGLHGTRRDRRELEHRHRHAARSARRSVRTLPQAARILRSGSRHLGL